MNLTVSAGSGLKTPCGLTEEFSLSEIVLQGSVFGSLKCCVQCDTLGRDCLSDIEGLGIYKYKGTIDIPPLSLIDDVICVSECGVKTVEINALVNAKFESKKLRLSDDKSVKIHLSKGKEKRCPIKTMIHEKTMKETDRVRYLGDKLSNLGGHQLTIESRVAKAIGIKAQISSLLKSISLGFFHFEIAMILRESLFLNSILLNSETFYYINKKQMESLESSDISIMQSIFNSQRNTVREAYYLETGKIQIRYIIAKRRFMFLHHILTRDTSELINKVYHTQQLIKTKYDWYDLMQSEKNKYNIELSDAEISVMSKNKFKKYVELKVNKVAFETLMSSDKSKVQNIIQFTKQSKDGRFKQQEYLRSTKLSTLEKQTIF